MHTNAKMSLSRIESQLGEPLPRFLQRWYLEGHFSFAEIAQMVCEEKGVSVHESTLRRWYWRLMGQPRSISEAMRFFYHPEEWF